MHKIIASLVLVLTTSACGSIYITAADQEMLTQDLCSRTVDCLGIDKKEWACPENFFDEGPCQEENFRAMECVHQHGTCNKNDGLVAGAGVCDFLFMIDEICLQHQQ